MKKRLLFLILLGEFLALPKIILAVVTIESMAARIAQTTWLVGTAIVVIFWVITGILFLTALGDPSKLQTAKKALFAAIGGTVIVVLATSAIVIIANAIGA